MKPAHYEYQSDFARQYFSEGRAKGQEEGLAEGKAELLIQLAISKFGAVPRLESRIRVATPAELDAMAGRLLSATTLEDFLPDAAPTPNG